MVSPDKSLITQILVYILYLSTDYFGTQQIIFGNNMNVIGNHFLYQVRGQISYIWVFNETYTSYLMHFYSIYVIAEYILSGSEIICHRYILYYHSEGVFNHVVVKEHSFWWPFTIHWNEQPRLSINRFVHFCMKHID